ncbi:hypothetical protein OBBRIDRAFT_766938 [Obba rivulosa]|uniref:Uncharacterized protein n=1 Tax=Obba rivulosa TaxID=1052685 RepID=A0A8E2DU77_9APHY|nr:hypothetical protein OBBRIDRAFT_766938 [Obba rivulosa]
MFARPPRIPPLTSLFSPLTRIPASSARAYSISLKPSVTWSKKKERKYEKHKAFLYQKYYRLLNQSFRQPLVFMHFADITVPTLTELRREVKAATERHAAKSGASPPHELRPSEQAHFTIVRTSIFGVVLREHPAVDPVAARELASLVSAGLAVLSFGKFDPPEVSAVLRAVARAIPPRKPKAPEQLEQEKKEAEASFVPGRRPKRQRPTPVPDLRVLGALIEGKVFKAENMAQLTGLPTLDTLRAQMVGLLTTPSAQLAMVLSEASGGKLARTLEGFKKTLEETEKIDAPPAETS